MYIPSYAHTHTPHTLTVEWSDEEGSLEEEDQESDDEQFLTGKIGTKKMRRIQAKAEKKAQREVEGVMASAFVLLLSPGSFAGTCTDPSL